MLLVNQDEKCKDKEQRKMKSYFSRHLCVFLFCEMVGQGSDGMKGINFFIFCLELIFITIEERNFIKTRLLDCSDLSEIRADMREGYEYELEIATQNSSAPSNNDAKETSPLINNDT